MEKVNHPPHYCGPIECIDAIEASMSHEAFIGFCKGNVIKYIWRAGSKDSEDAIDDMKKAAWYLDRMIETMSRDTKGREP